MFSAKVKADIDPATIFAKRRDGIKNAQIWLDKSVVTDSERFVPRLDGDLRRSARTMNDYGSGKVGWFTVYARKLYYMVARKDGSPIKYTEPGTTHHWFEKAKSIHLGSWLAGVAKILGGR